MNHAQLVDQIGAAADDRGYWWHAGPPDVRQERGHPGWVDIVILGPGGALLVEAKTEGATRTLAQRQVARRIRALGLRYLLCFPRDLEPGGRLAAALDAIS
jgi:hypothetical protein